MILSSATAQETSAGTSGFLVEPSAAIHAIYTAPYTQESQSEQIHSLCKKKVLLEQGNSALFSSTGK